MVLVAVSFCVYYCKLVQREVVKDFMNCTTVQKKNDMSSVWWGWEGGGAVKTPEMLRNLTTIR